MTNREESMICELCGIRSIQKWYKKRYICLECYEELKKNAK